MSNTHAWRMIHSGSDQFAASDILVKCATADESEARTRAGWNAMSAKGEVSMIYLGMLSNDEYEARRAEHPGS